tara:strand:+ start:337 stop:477 length:141 start_codon:yes stop_codon:yes gene_type:complete
MFAALILTLMIVSIPFLMLINFVILGELFEQDKNRKASRRGTRRNR